MSNAPTADEARRLVAEGVALQRAEQPEAAFALYARAISVDPAQPEALANMGVIAEALGRIREAEGFYRAALAVERDFPPALANLGNLLVAMGRTQEGLAFQTTAAEARPDDQGLRSNLLLSMHYGAADPRSVFAAHHTWGDSLAYHAAPDFPNDPDPERRIRIGYVSPDFRRHSVAYCLLPVLERHDRTRFEINLYSDVARPDELTTRFETLADRWRPTRSLDHAALADAVRADRVDILVDLAGHSAGNRLPVFARRAAPVQASWLGYPGTTGLASMDYRIVDPVTDLAPGADALATESLVRLEQGFLAYVPPSGMPPVTALPALTNGVVTFGSFNNLAKLSADTLGLWARLLAIVPGARLVLKSSRPTDGSVERRFREIFAGHGVDGGRVTLLPYAQGAVAHLGAYAAIDIALDPFPYNGTVTTLEALAMGVPVVTLAGAAHAGRVGAAILTRLGRSGWIARSPEEYLSIAGSLAADMPALARTRAALRDALADSPIGRADMVGDLEAAYRAMWHAWCARQP